MDAEWHFPVMIAGALVEFVLLLRLILGAEETRRRRWRVGLVSFTVVVVGMAIGKYGAGAGLAWWVYYPVPALMTLLLPPLAFRLPPRKNAVYLVFAALSAPLLHCAFSLLLGWKEYMPFLPVPSIAELVR